MTAPNQDGQVWRKSSRSAREHCVEVAFTPDERAVRDSKDPAGPILAFGPAAFGRFLTAARNGRFTPH